MSLTKAEILAASDRPATKVDVPQWGGDVYVRGLSGSEKDAIESWQINNPTMIGLRAQVVAKGLCDEHGVPLDFTPAEVVDLGDKAGGILDRLYLKVCELSAWTDEDRRKLEGNSDAGQSD